MADDPDAELRLLAEQGRRAEADRLAAERRELARPSPEARRYRAEQKRAARFREQQRALIGDRVWALDDESIVRALSFWPAPIPRVAQGLGIACVVALFGLSALLLPEAPFEVWLGISFGVGGFGGAMLYGAIAHRRAPVWHIRRLIAAPWAFDVDRYLHCLSHRAQFQRLRVRVEVEDQLPIAAQEQVRLAISGLVPGASISWEAGKGGAFVVVSPSIQTGGFGEDQDGYVNDDLHLFFLRLVDKGLPAIHRAKTVVAVVVEREAV